MARWTMCYNYEYFIIQYLAETELLVSVDESLDYLHDDLLSIRIIIQEVDHVQPRVVEFLTDLHRHIYIAYSTY